MKFEIKDCEIGNLIELISLCKMIDLEYKFIPYSGILYIYAVRKYFIDKIESYLKKNSIEYIIN